METRQQGSSCPESAHLCPGGAAPVGTGRCDTCTRAGWSRVGRGLPRTTVVTVARPLLLHVEPQAAEGQFGEAWEPERQTQTLASPIPTLALGVRAAVSAPRRGAGLGSVRHRPESVPSGRAPGATAPHSPCRRSDCSTRLSVLLEWRLPVRACGSDSAGVLGLGRGCLPASRIWGAPIEAGENTESQWFSHWVPRALGAQKD